MYNSGKFILFGPEDMQRTTAVFFVAVLFINPFAAAQTEGQSSKYDASTPRLPIGYEGDSYESLHGSLPVAKDEFETSQHFEARLAAAAPRGTHAFVLHDPTILYDADKSQFRIPVITVDAIRGYSVNSYYVTFPLRTQTVQTRTYAANTAAGGTRDVTEETRKQYVVIALNGKSGDWPTLTFSAAPESARSLKPNLRVLLVCNFDGLSALLPALDPKTNAGAFRRATGYAATMPTFNVPKVKITYQFALVGEVLGFVVFDRSTGDVLARFDQEGNAVQANQRSASGSGH